VKEQKIVQRSGTAFSKTNLPEQTLKKPQNYLFFFCYILPCCIKADHLIESRPRSPNGKCTSQKGFLFVMYTFRLGNTVAQWLRCCATNRKVAGSISARVIDIKSFLSHYGAGVNSASNRNEYQEHFLGGKGGRCLRLTTLPPFCAVVMKSGNLNFLEPSGPLQA